jgi:hypothetical protein
LGLRSGICAGVDPVVPLHLTCFTRNHTKVIIQPGNGGNKAILLVPVAIFWRFLLELEIFGVNAARRFNAGLACFCGPSVSPGQGGGWHIAPAASYDILAFAGA